MCKTKTKTKNTASYMNAILSLLHLQRILPLPDLKFSIQGLRGRPSRTSSDDRRGEKATMCGCCDGCGERVCCCIPYGVRDDIKNCLILLAVVAGLVVVAGVVIVIVIFGGPLRHVRITVEDASLTRFALVNEPPTTALAYNLTVALAVRNPN